MWNDFFAKNTLVPLLLRAVLAVIFIYTGLQKITGLRNDWGATWANNMQTREIKPPDEVVARLNQYLSARENLPPDASPEQKQARMHEFIAELPRQEQAKEEPQPQEEKDEGTRKIMLLPPDIVDRLRVAYAETVDARFAAQATAGATQLHSSIQLLVAWGELLGGIALLAGILTRWASLGLIIIQFGAIYMVTWAQGLSSLQGGGYGYNVALIAMLLALVLTGGGSLAVDRLIRRGRRTAAEKPAAVAAV